MSMVPLNMSSGDIEHGRHLLRDGVTYICNDWNVGQYHLELALRPAGGLN